MKHYKVCAYYFPNFHPDPRSDEWYGEGFTEWQLVRDARPRFPGHSQPRVPLWGTGDESDPRVMSQKIEQARSHGIDCFLFDWYWYDGRPYLSDCLDRGFLGAENSDQLEFALMWANHDWQNIHPAERIGDRVSGEVLAEGRVSEQSFLRAAETVTERYFSRPNYMKRNGKCYFSFYMIFNLIRSFGSVSETRRMLDAFRNLAAKRGSEIHFNAVVWGAPVLPNDDRPADLNAVTEALGIDSVTSYVWPQIEALSEFPVQGYREYAEVCMKRQRELASAFRLPHIPNVTAGWDSSPRTRACDPFDQIGYPFWPALTRDPAAFEDALREVRQMLDERNEEMVTINAWNEWTEGSYLEPDEECGTAYLDAVARVFKRD